MRIMVQQDPDDFLGNVAVDEAAGESMAPLMGRQVHRPAVFVADLTGLQPAAEHPPVGAVCQREVPGDVGAFSRKQAGRAVRPLVQHPPLLITDGGFEFFVDGDGCLASHLGVEVAQIGGALAIAQEAVEVESQGTGDPQPAPGEDERGQPAGGAGPAVQAGGCLDLGHDVLGETAVDLLGDRRSVAEVERRSAGQRIVPPVLPDVLEEQVEPADPGLLHPPSAGLGGDVGEIAFQQRPADSGESVNAGQGEERAEADESVHSGPGCADAQPRGQAESRPSLGELAQPGLGDAVKPQPGARAGATCRDGDAGQLVQPPHVPGVLDLPAGPVPQRLQRIPGVDQEQGRLADLGTSALPPLLLGQVQQ